MTPGHNAASRSRRGLWPAGLPVALLVAGCLGTTPAASPDGASEPDATAGRDAAPVSDASEAADLAPDSASLPRDGGPCSCAGAAPLAATQAGVCAGLRQRCDPLRCRWEDPDPAQSGLTGWEPDETLCDGLDNDCDGVTDEGHPVGQPCVAGLGLCARSGSQVCAAGHRSTVCDAQPGTPAVERCGDGLDEDCDGATDEPEQDPCPPPLGGTVAGSAPFQPPGRRSS